MARVFLTRRFAKFSRKNRIEDAALIEAIHRAEEGKVDADLRGCLVKIRIARPKEGRSGGYRTVVAYRKGDRAFFLYGFAKNVRENIDTIEETELDAYGSLLLGLTEPMLLALIADRKIIEIREEG